MLNIKTRKRLALVGKGYTYALVIKRVCYLMVTEDGNLPVGAVVGQHLSGHVVRGVGELVQLLLQREGGVVGTEHLRCEALPTNRKSIIMLISNFFLETHMSCCRYWLRMLVFNLSNRSSSSFLFSLNSFRFLKTLFSTGTKL